MRRTFWAEVFANPAPEIAPAGREGESVNPGGSAVVLASFPGKDGNDCVMARAMAVAGSEVYWVAQEIGGWLSMLLSRDQSADAVGWVC